MPHVLLERIRSIDHLFQFHCFTRQESPFPSSAFVIETLDLVASVIFLVGSFCFLPHYAKDLEVFLAGCILFVVGAVMLLAISMFCWVEAMLHHKSACTFEACEHMLYVIGSWMFVVGTILYWPTKAHYAQVKVLQDFSLGQYFNLFSPEFEGTLLFTLGSVIFAFAAFTNALNHRKYEAEMSQMLTAVTTLYMGGDMLFIIGSVAFLPDVGCNKKMVTIGAWTFILGSALFIIGALLSMFRTLQIWRMGERAYLGSKGMPQTS